MLLAALALLALVQKPPAQISAAERPTLERVVVVGASLAAGFGARCTFAEALTASLRAPLHPPLGLGDELFFTSPLTFGARQIEQAVEAEPTLVVGIDFLFWFGYGTFDARGGSIDDEAERLELLDKGLSLLDELECPLVVGDFPDMSAAVGKMISAAQMPELSTLPLLSKRVREWAAGRERVLVLPISELAAKLASGKEIQVGKYTFPAGTRLLQRDQLHPTLEGLVAASQLAFEHLIA
ncbi:MAG TPA: hypothetical protein VMV01_07880, partial [Planctomycetota bacterium]|nr:hypothetical protein [Planctomycetota bacterium]